MAKPFDVVTPVEYKAGDQTKTRWVRIGAAWPKDDGKWSVQLDALPVNGKAMIMPPKEKPDDVPGF